jgi:hypothetical protein
MHKIKLLPEELFSLLYCSITLEQDVYWASCSRASCVDKTNQSYYGETKLNYLTTDRAFEGIVPLSKYLGFDETVPFVSSC